MNESSPHAIVWQVVAPDEVAQSAVEGLLRSHGHRVILKGILAPGAPLGIVRAAISLTIREREVLSALLRYDGNPEVARALGVSLSTVRYHLANLMEQFGVGSRHRLLASALLSGLLSTNENDSPENPIR